MSIFLTEGTADEAKKLNLTYIGFGRYADAQGQYAYKVKGNQLVPVDKSMQAPPAPSTADVHPIFASMKKDNQKVHSMLSKHYKPSNYSGDELKAIKDFTSGAWADVNEILNQLPAGVSPGHIDLQPEEEDYLDLIETLDNALLKGVAPKDFYTYVALGPNIDAKGMKAGSSFTFKGYKSTSVMMDNVLTGMSDHVEQTGDLTVLQIKVPEGSPGMYLDSFSVNANENEFLLPRAATIAINSNGEKVSDDVNLTYFDCEFLMN